MRQGGDFDVGCHKTAEQFEGFLQVQKVKTSVVYPAHRKQCRLSQTADSSNTFSFKWCVNNAIYLFENKKLNYAS